VRLYSICLVIGVSTLTGAPAPQNTQIPDSNPIARTSASEVLLDVVVLDKHGKPVKNLKAGDVQVSEGGFRHKSPVSASFQPPKYKARAPTKP
jgi:hypothetical protein